MKKYPPLKDQQTLAPSISSHFLRQITRPKQFKYFASPNYFLGSSHRKIIRYLWKKFQNKSSKKYYAVLGKTKSLNQMDVPSNSFWPFLTPLVQTRSNWQKKQRQEVSIEFTIVVRPKPTGINLCHNRQSQDLGRQLVHVTKLKGSIETNVQQYPPKERWVSFEPLTCCSDTNC